MATAFAYILNMFMYLRRRACEEITEANPIQMHFRKKKKPSRHRRN